jgi:hypothetical protein
MSYKGPPIPTIRRFGIDVEEQTAVFELADGAEFEVPFPRSLSPGEAGIRRAKYDVTSSEFIATLPMGDEIALEMDKPGTQSRQPSTPVVYLDQLHWVTLAQRRWAPGKTLEGQLRRGRRTDGNGRGTRDHHRDFIGKSD